MTASPATVPQPGAVLRAAAQRLVDVANGPDIPVFREGAGRLWEQVRTGKALAGLARLLTVYRNSLTEAEAEAARLILMRARAAGIDPDEELRRLRRAAGPGLAAVAPAPAPTQRPVRRDTLVEPEEAGYRLDIDVSGHRAKVRFDKGTPVFPQLRAAMRAHDAVFNERRLIPSYWIMPADELLGLGKTLDAHKVRGVSRSSLQRALVRLAADADDRAAAVKWARTATLRFPPGCKPYPHQDAGIRFLLGRKSALLADDQGLGKTLQAVIAIEHQLDPRDQILICCPATLTHNWKAEIGKWSPGAKVAVVTTKTVVPNTCRYVITSYDGAKRTEKDPTTGKKIDTPLRAALTGRRWGLVVCDEAQFLKNPDSARHKLVADIRRDRTWLLTGTPMANRPLDLWGLLVLGDHPLAVDKIRYAKRYCQGVRTEHGWDMKGASNLAELSEKLSDWMLRREKDEVLDLPGKVRVEQVVEVPRSIARATFADIGAMMRGRSELAQAKVPATWERVESILDADQKVIVFSESLGALNALQAHCQKAGVGFVRIDGSVAGGEKRMAIVNQFQNDPKTRVFLGQTIAAGAGITLTAATNVVFNDLSMVPAYHAQAEDRAYRIGTTKRVTITYMLADAKLDRACWKMLQDKIAVIRSFESGLGDADQAVQAGAKALFAALLRTP